LSVYVPDVVVFFSPQPASNKVIMHMITIAFNNLLFLIVTPHFLKF